MDARVIGGAALSAAAAMASHWFPLTEPHKPYGTQRKLYAYTAGTSAILAGIAIATDVQTVRRIIPVVAATGAATVAAYVIDGALNRRARRRAYGR